MNESQSTVKILLLVILAMLFGGLLFAQETMQSEAEAAALDTTQAKPAAASEETEPALSDPAATESTSETPPVTQPTSATAPAPESRHVTRQSAIASLTIFVFVVLVGFEVISKVPPTLHTPLMSGSNAISGITLVGAVLVAASLSFSGFIGFLAVTLATINVVGGFLVTHRMLAMFKKR
jgi:NAD(P) transhydrogenase subunit alpha